MGKGSDEVRTTTWTAEEGGPGRYTGTSGVADTSGLGTTGTTSETATGGYKSYAEKRHDRSDEGKSSSEIRRDIEHTRAEMDETIRALKGKLAPGTMAERAMDTVWEGARVEMEDMVKAARRNPLPAGLVAAGIAWLFYDTLTYSRREQFEGIEAADLGAEQTYGYKPKGKLGRIKDKAMGAIRGTAHGVRGVAERARDAGGSLAERARGFRHREEETGEIMGYTSEGYIGESMGETSQGFISRAKERGAHFAGSARERASNLASGTRERVSNVAHRAGDVTYEQARRVKSGFNTSLEEHPLAVCLAAFAVGTALALSLPTTRKESELMGETRDRLLERAKERGQEVAEKAKTVAQETLSTAKEKAREEFADMKPSEQGQGIQGGSEGMQSGQGQSAKTGGSTYERHEERHTVEGEGPIS